MNDPIFFRSRAVIVYSVAMVVASGFGAYLTWDNRSDLGQTRAQTERLDRALKHGIDNDRRLRGLQRDLSDTQKLSDHRFRELLRILTAVGIDTSSIEGGTPNEPQAPEQAGPTGPDPGGSGVPGDGAGGGGGGADPPPAPDPPDPPPDSPGTPPAAQPDPAPPAPVSPSLGGLDIPTPVDPVLCNLPVSLCR